MPEISGVRSGGSSTATMEEASELAHVVTEKEAKGLDWHADHSTWKEEWAGRHDAPGATVRGALEFVTKQPLTKPALQATGVAFVVKNLPELRTDPKKVLLEKIAQPLKEYATRLLAPTVRTAGAATLGESAAAAFTPLLAIAALTAPSAAVIGEGFAEGDKLKRLSQLDAIDYATTCLLKLDVGFQAADIKKHDVDKPLALFTFMAESDFGKQHLPQMQADADEGMRAAFAAIRCGRAEYLNTYKEVATRLNDDIAFNKGFECVMWCNAQPDGLVRLAELQKAVDSRDPRAAQPAVVIHG